MLQAAESDLRPTGGNIDASGFESEDLPDYARRLDAFHRAADREFHAALARLPLEDVSHVMDLATGDGYFARVLAREFPQLRILAADCSASYRLQCTQRNERAGLADRIEVIDLDATKMSLDDQSQAAIFCGYSFQSISEHAQVLSECRRVLRPGGILMLLESDGLHSWLLPLPPQLEMRMKSVELKDYADDGIQDGWTFSRRCGALLDEAGYRVESARTFAIDRLAPFQGDDRVYLESEFAEILKHLADQKSDCLEQAKSYLEPHGSRSIFQQPQAYVSSLHTLFVARKPPA